MNLNFLKGLLIILVIVDHNEFSRKLFPAFLLGMTFHVVGFMTIPFLKAPHKLLSAQFAHYAFRLYFPFLLVSCAMWALVTLLGQAPFMERLGMLGVALYSGNADALKGATQMGLLWFLPSFISVVALRALVDSCAAWPRALAIAALWVLHFAVGMAKPLQDVLPLGLLPAIYIVPLAYLGAALHQRVFAPASAPLATAGAVLLFALVKSAQMAMGLDTEVGFASVADWRDPLAVLVNDLEAVCGTLMLFQCARWDVKGLIDLCGRYSMQMYLFHAFIALALYKAALLLAPDSGYALLFGVSVCATIVLTVLFAHGLMAIPRLKSLVFPRNPRELLRGPPPPGAAAALE